MTFQEAAMLDNPTLRQLHDLRLTVMAAKLREQQEQPDIACLSFEERLGLLVEAELFSRRTKRIDKLIAQAAFRFEASLEDIDYQGKHGITKPDILRLSTGNYLRKYFNILVSGPTGVGKTYLACALGHAACSQGVPVLYTRLSDLFLRLSEAHLEGRYLDLREKLSKVPLLILDDWGLRKFSLEETHEIMEIVERHYGRAATIISGQLPVSAWHELFPDPTLADAIVDRLIHNAYKYNITGASMRNERMN
jgi:DNA replication protein DnaC